MFGDVPAFADTIHISMSNGGISSLCIVHVSRIRRAATNPDDFESCTSAEVKAGSNRLKYLTRSKLCTAVLADTSGKFV